MGKSDKSTRALGAVECFAALSTFTVGEEHRERSLPYWSRSEKRSGTAPNCDRWRER